MRAARLQAMTANNPVLEVRRGVDLPEMDHGADVRSSRYWEAEQDYLEEPRAEPWANHHESAVRDVLRETGVLSEVLAVHCRERTCRLAMRDMEREDIDTLLGSPAFQRATGQGADAPYSLRGGRFVLHFRPSDGPIE